MKAENKEKLRPYVGQKLKYKEICEILGWKYQTKLNDSKKAQFKELESICKYEAEGERKGLRYMILEIYEKELEKIDKRKEGNNNKFGFDLEVTLMYLLQDRKSIQISVNKALQLTHLVNENYAVGRRDIPLASKILEVDKGYLYAFYDNHHKNTRDTFERTLKKLRKRALLMADIVTFVCTDKVEIEHNAMGEPVVERGKIKYKVREEFNVATDEQKDVILKAEKLVMEKMGVNNHQEVFLAGLWKSFKEDVERIIQQEGNIKYYFDGYHVAINDMGVKSDIQQYEAEIAKISTNEKRVKSISRSIQTRHKKNEWSDNIYGKEEYVEASNKLVDALISADTELNLSVEISKTKNKKLKQVKDSIEVNQEQEVSDNRKEDNEGIPF